MQSSSLLTSIVGIPSEASVASAGILDTRIPTIEQTIRSMAVDIENGLDTSIEIFFLSIQMQAPVVQGKDPPGGASAGGGH